MEKCKFCHPDESGNYNMVMFASDEIPDTWLHLFTYGGEITIVTNFTARGHGGATMSTPINFCPFCGERVRKEEQAS